MSCFRRSLLHGLSYLYRGGIAMRNFAYDRGIINVREASIPVVSIGNIMAGGTGKTPLVKFLAEELLKTSNVAILSRGYRSTAEKKNLLVTPTTSVAECGDEPYWLAGQLPKAQIWVGGDRFKSAGQARQNGAEVIILDDGMQHRRFKRDFEIVLVNGEETKDFFLPRGLLRDSPSRLKNADLIVTIDPQEEIALNRFTSAPIVVIRRRTEISLKGKQVAVFCAIGNPKRFLESVREAGGEIIASFFKPDHDLFYPEELERFSSAGLLVCTEKDRVKLPKDLPFPVVALSSFLEIEKGQDAWQQLLTNIRGLI